MHRQHAQHTHYGLRKSGRPPHDHRERGGWGPIRLGQACGSMWAVECINKELRSEVTAHSANMRRILFYTCFLGSWQLVAHAHTHKFHCEPDGSFGVWRAEWC